MSTSTIFNLTTLDDTSEDIDASALISVDGLVMETTLPHTMKMDYLGSICAAAILLGQHASDRCASGALENVIIRCEKNLIIMAYAGTDSILAVITKHGANLETILLEIKRFADKLDLVNTSIPIDTKNIPYRSGRGWVAQAH